MGLWKYFVGIVFGSIWEFFSCCGLEVFIVYCIVLGMMFVDYVGMNWRGFGICGEGWGDRGVVGEVFWGCGVRWK